MTVRFPAPPQGWSALRWEVGVVFVGIALALLAQQLADNLYWRAQAAQAKRNIEAELLQHERDGYERLSVQPCLKGQLKTLADRLSRGSEDWIATPVAVNPGASREAAVRAIPSAYRAPERLWPEEAWQTARSSGALNYLPDAVVANWAEAYGRGRRIYDLQDREAEGAARITALAVDGRMDASTRSELLGAIGEIDHDNAYIELAVGQSLDELRTALRTIPAARRKNGIAGRLRVQREFRGACVEDVPIRL